MEQLFDDLDDFGAFDDAISGDVRDPYTELARLRREEPVQRLETSGALPHEECPEVAGEKGGFFGGGRHRGVGASARRRRDAGYGGADTRAVAVAGVES